MRREQRSSPACRRNVNRRYRALMARGAVAWVALIAIAGVRPDLVVVSVAAIQHGTSVRVTDVVRNRGSGTARRSTTGFYVADVRIGSRGVGVLAPGATSRTSTILTIPATVKPGSYRVLACADDRRRVLESSERNNCRASTRKIDVTDLSPPKFAGLTAATTCIPGPVGGRVRDSSYYLKWPAASEDRK